MHRFLPAVVLLLLFSAHTASARTWYITSDGTGDAPTIQAGLDSAIVGDTVFVASGIYNVDIVFWPDRNGIVLRGAGMDSTIVVGDTWQAVIYFASVVPIDTSTVIQGITVRNGGGGGIILYGTSPLVDSCRIDSTIGGPGVYAVSGASAVIRHCQILNNGSSGIRIEDTNPTFVITENRIIGNSATDLFARQPTRIYYPMGITLPEIDTNGGGIYCDQAAARINGNLISNNEAEDGGGGIWIESAYGDTSTIVVDNEIIGNRVLDGWPGGGGVSCSGGYLRDNSIRENTVSSGDGGGIYCRGSRVQSNTITGNSADERGGGIFASVDSAALSDNIISFNNAKVGGGVYTYGVDVFRNMFYANVADSLGGGLYARFNATTVGNIFAENVSYTRGGGLYFRDVSDDSVTDNSIVRNRTINYGGGIYVEGAQPRFVRNTIIENHADSLGDGIYTDGSTMTLSLNNIAYNGWGGWNPDPIVIPTAHNNWWGDPTGPYHQGYNPAGQGDSLSPYLWDFQPWLSEADTIAPPFPPQNLIASTQADGSILLTWDAVALGDLAGYRVHFDTDTIGFPYADSIDFGSGTMHMLMNLQDETTYYLAVSCYDNSGDRSYYSAPDSATTGIITGVMNTSIPANYWLGNNSPNPFNPTTTIGFNLPQAGEVLLAVFDVTGRLVATLVDGMLQPGEFSYQWDGKNAAGEPVRSSIYFARLEAGEFTAVRKMVLLR